MNSQQYRQLSAAQRRTVWEQLEATPGWQLLQEWYQAEIANPIEMQDVDSQVAFQYRAIRGQAFQKILSHPRQAIQALDRKPL